jgi:hypothetical protein
MSTDTVHVLTTMNYELVGLDRIVVYLTAPLQYIVSNEGMISEL